MLLLIIIIIIIIILFLSCFLKLYANVRARQPELCSASAVFIKLTPTVGYSR